MSAATVSCLTPPGAAALAVLGLSGPGAWDVVRALFRRGPERAPLPDAPEAGRTWLGWLGDELKDQVVLAVKAASPVPRLELHCHGGREVVRLLLESFAARGARVESWEEWLRGAEGDPLRAEAAAELARALTPRAAAVLLDQYHGAFARALAGARAALERGDAAAARPPLEEPAGRAGVGRHLTAPWRVVIAGAPNVGKSSLLNALAGYQRCVVAATPGTTRDVVTALVAVDGWPAEVADTAGLREGGGVLEEEGMRRARAAAEAADLCLWVVDASAEPVWPAFARDNVLVVINKTDLPAAWAAAVPGAVRVSARTGEGVTDLCQSIARALVPCPPPPGAAVPFTPAWCERIRAALRACAAGRAAEALRALEE